MVLYSYLHHSLEVQFVWIYLLLKQKPSVSAELFPAEKKKKKQNQNTFFFCKSCASTLISPPPLKFDDCTICDCAYILLW